jgi:formate hydrogenlyase subunit 3/multisubunit Na+/H+ antiporter MnhD subunit
MSAFPGWQLPALGCALAIYAGAALAGAVAPRRALSFVYPVCAAAAVLAAAADLSVFFTQANLQAHLPIGLPTIGLHIRLDALSAFFGLIVNIGVFASSIYGLGLGGSDLSKRIEPFYPAFCAAMNAVMLADDAYGFLFCWEIMSLCSWALVVSRHENEENRKAGYVYLVMAAFGTFALLCAFGGMAGAAGGYTFDAMRANHLTPLVSGLVLAAALAGTGSKAGIMPLHAWLPLAHPAAPSHVSALMSGVMTKVAVYAIIRIVFDLLGNPQWWWALPFIILGAASAVGGLLYAVQDQDLKRLLAYSTIENIGIIFAGIGLAIAFKSSGIRYGAAVAMAAALIHSLNHSWFKSLLFLGAGAVLHATGRKDLDGLGGLIHRMPKTAFYWLIGALSIAALPPLNGFVSEWLLFQAVLVGPVFPEPILRFLSPVAGAMLALAAGLAAACFVRAYGTVFLGRPRSEEAGAAHEAPAAQTIAIGLLAVLCALGGLFGGFTAYAIGPLLTSLAGASLMKLGDGPTPFSLIAFDQGRAIYDAPTIALFVAISAIATMVAVHLLANKKTRRSPAWDCGFPDASPATQYTASSFSQPLRRVYGGIVFKATEDVDMPGPGELRPAGFLVRYSDHIWRYLYLEPAGTLWSVSKQFNALHFLSIRLYLVAMFCTLIALLIIAATWM